MPEFEEFGDKGSEVCNFVVRGVSDTHPRRLSVKRYAGASDIQIGVGPANKTKAKAAARFSVDEGEELAERIYEACEAARKEINAKG